MFVEQRLSCLELTTLEGPFRRVNVVHRFGMELNKIDFHPFAGQLWTAPEVLRDYSKTGTREGDVYGFAFLLYEMYGRNGPYGSCELGPEGKLIVQGDVYGFTFLLYEMYGRNGPYGSCELGPEGKLIVQGDVYGFAFLLYEMYGRNGPYGSCELGPEGKPSTVGHTMK